MTTSRRRLMTMWAIPTNYGKDWYQARQAALKRDGLVGVFCSSLHPLRVHHIRPRRLGGTNDLWNLITLCQNCHLECHAEIRWFGLCTVPSQDYESHWYDLKDHDAVMLYAAHLDSIGISGEVLRQKELLRQSS